MGARIEALTGLRFATLLLLLLVGCWNRPYSEDFAACRHSVSRNAVS
jgi:hypothetical protein